MFFLPKIIPFYPANPLPSIFSYQILCPKLIQGVPDPKKCAQIILESTALPEDNYRLGNTKARFIILILLLLSLMKNEEGKCILIVLSILLHTHTSWWRSVVNMQIAFYFQSKHFIIICGVDVPNMILKNDIAAVFRRVYTELILQLACYKFIIEKQNNEREPYPFSL